MTPEIDRQVQKSIIRKLGDSQNTTPTTVKILSNTLLQKAFDSEYQIVTRFIPPYCTTVTFYNKDIGFVTVSRLNASFDHGIVNIGDGHWVTQAACDTIEDAYIDLINERSRHRQRHENAMHEALENSKIPEKRWRKGQFYIRLEGQKDVSKTFLLHTDSNQATARYQMELDPLQTWYSVILNAIFSLVAYLLHLLLFKNVANIFHWLFFKSSVRLEHGPACVLNDIFYNTHGGKFARNVHIISKELSAQLSATGTIVAFFNLNWVNAILAAIVALVTTVTVNNKTGKIAASAVLGGLVLLQAVWTFWISSTSYENIISGDIRLRSSRQAASLFGLNVGDLKLLLAIVSPWSEINAHGDYNSYVDISETGVLDVFGPDLSPVLYLAGYITSSFSFPEGPGISQDTSPMPVAVWVPYDTHRISFGSNDVVRKLSLIDNAFHLSGSKRSSITRTSDATLVVKHDSDEVDLPEHLEIYPGYAVA